MSSDRDRPVLRAVVESMALERGGCKPFRGGALILRRLPLRRIGIRALVGERSWKEMTELVLKVSDIHVLALTCGQCGAGLTLDLTRDGTIPDACPLCVSRWADAGLVRNLANALKELLDLDTGPLGISFRIPAA